MFRPLTLKLKPTLDCLVVEDDVVDTTSSTKDGVNTNT